VESGFSPTSENPAEAGFHVRVEGLEAEALMMGRWLIGLGGTALLGAVVFTTVPASAQTETAKIWTGVYTDAQASKGETTYAAMCSRCHSTNLAGSQVAANFAPALGGDKFMAAWETRPVDRLFKTIRDTMPRGTEGLLNDQSALELVAYILKYNGYPAGSAALAPSSDLASLLIMPKAGAAKREAVNFAVVQVTGCVTPAGARWSLTQATDPVVATVAASAGTPATTSGAQTFRLVNAAPFKVDGESGKQVRVQGLLRRDPDENLLSVTSLTPTGVACTN
jgi:hypothetical protein